MRIEVYAADDAADDDAWGWSGELDVGEAAAGSGSGQCCRASEGGCSS